MSAKEVLRELAGKVWDEAKPSFDHGRSELISGLMTGNSFVMYPRAEQAAEQQAELPMAVEVGEPEKPMNMDQLRALAREMEADRASAQERDRGGMEM